jgi:hypothetical protein
MKRLSIFLGSIILLFNACNTSNGNTVDAQSYQEKVMSVQEIENSEPTKFLSADGSYNSNFWGDKFKVHGKITNTATAASYKDAVVRVTYYSKTGTELATNEYTIYDFFPPNSVKNFELKIQNYQDVKSIGWDVVGAQISQ